MKIRLISKHGDAIALAYKCLAEGNKVDFWVKDKAASGTYKGLMPQVASWNKGLSNGGKRDTVILFDMVGLGSIADNLKKSGYAVYGGGKLNDSLELNRKFGLKVAKAAGIRAPSSENFTSFDKARKYIAGKGGRYVFKPGNNQLPAFTYVSDDAEDMSEMLDHFESKWSGSVDFILQEYISGQEMSCEGFYINGELLPGSLNSTLETKRFMEGDKGSNTGCMSSVVRFWKETEPKIYRQTLKRLSSFLRRFHYTGPLDVNCIVSEKDKMPYFLEFTARFGYNAVYAAAEALDMPLSEFLAGLARGKLKLIKPKYEWTGAVRVSIPPYPGELGVAKSEGRPIRGTDSLEHIWLLDAKSDSGKLVTAGVDGVVCEVTGIDPTLSGLAGKIYKVIEGLKIPDKQYRSDGISSAERRITTLREWRYI